MASSRRTARSSVKNQLFQQPFRFSFVQAIRVLERVRHWERDSARPLGYDAEPGTELVRLNGKAGLSFPPTEVTGLSQPSSNDGRDRPDRPVLTVALMGLYGASGVLPYYDTQRIIDQGGRKNPEKDLLDLFNHRILSYYYRALTKYRVPVAYEQYLASKSDKESLVTTALLAVAGMATPGLQRRLEFADELTIEYCQFFGHRPQNAISLCRMLQAYLKLPVEVIQFQGQWLQLASEDKSLMPTRQMPSGQNCRLGQDFIVGDRVWDIQGQFRIRLGPLSLNEFQDLLPHSKKMKQLAQLVRLYVGNQLDFEIQLELLAEDVPELALGSSFSRLGLNTWLINEQSSSNKRDAVFAPSGDPTG